MPAQTIWLKLMPKCKSEHEVSQKSMRHDEGIFHGNMLVNVMILGKWQIALCIYNLILADLHSIDK